MPDPGFREIQLTGKQLVFLFMASVVVAVAIFLLGVSVGRGVRGTTTASAEQAEDAGAVDVPATMPPETVLTPADLGYHNQLQGQGTPPAETPPPAPQTATATVPPAAAPETSRSGETHSSGVSTSAPPAAPAPAPEAGGWFVQTGAFGSRPNANRQVGELKSKGHAATVMTSSTAPAYRVRVGPFADRAEADRLAARLRAEGFTPSVTR